MFRLKTEIEKTETMEEHALRLREALFVLSLENDPDEMKRIARCAMAGELHGKEIPDKKIEIGPNPLPPPIRII